MSRHFLVERPPSGVNFPGQRRVYDPNKKPEQNKKVGKEKGYGWRSVPTDNLGRSRDEIRFRDSSAVDPELRRLGFDKEFTPHFAMFTVARSPGGNSFYGQPYRYGDADAPAQMVTPAPTPSEPPTLCLPLLKVAVKVKVDGTIARTTLFQKFSNKSDEPIPKATYTFPLYNGAIVTSFRYIVEGKELIGQVKPKKQAKKEFGEAVKNKQAAALLEEQTPEILETAVGNIPANSEVEVHITYVNQLRIATLDQHGAGEDQPVVGKELDVVIPMSIAPRYGGVHGGDTDIKFEKNGLDVVVEVIDNGTIMKMTSPTHSGVEFEESVSAKIVTVSSFDELFVGGSEPAKTLTQRVACYTSSKAILDGDFILTIETKPEYMLRSRAVISPPNNHGHAALMVNMRPSDIFEYDFRPTNFDGEVILILDRSGSMSSGYQTNSRPVTKIGTLRRALPLALVNLPSGCAFNFISFGTGTEFMWNESQPYSTNGIKHAKKYITEEVKANMGTTELLSAMEAAVKYRLKARSSTQIIIITDGEVDDIGIIDFLLKTRKEYGDKIRFFALGIGDEVSHLIIESIGEFGGGYGEVVNLAAKPHWEDRLSRMLRFGVTRSSWDFDISLGPGFERQSLVNYRIHDKPPAQQKGGIPFIQAPYLAPSFYPFAFYSIFFLLDVGSQTLPNQVTLTPKNTTSKSAHPHTLLVQETRTDRPTIHYLAIKALLTSLETESSQFDLTPSQTNLASENAERLGQMYSIASKWTSFVAVDRTADATGDEISTVKADMLEIDLAALQLISEMEGSTTASRSLCSSGANDEDEYGHDYDYEMSIDNKVSSGPILEGMSFDASYLSGSWEGAMETLSLSWHSSHSPDMSRQYSSSDDDDSIPDRDPTSDAVSWEEAVEALSQDSSRLFKFSSKSPSSDGSVRSAVERLHAHFCPGIIAKLMELFSGPLVVSVLGAEVDEQLEEMKCWVINTLLMIYYFKTHMSRQRDLWDMMVDNAEEGVVEILLGPLSKHQQFDSAASEETERESEKETDNVPETNPSLEAHEEECLDGKQVEALLTTANNMISDAAQHAHYLPTEDHPSDDESQSGPFPPSALVNQCPACGIVVQSTTSSKNGLREGVSGLICPHEDCEDSDKRWATWDELWRHQLAEDHVVCRRREWIGNLDREFEE